MSDESSVVLIVVNEPAISNSHAHMLPDTYDVRTATGGEEALDQFDEEVDVVLLDRRMPGLSGDEVLERIRERPTDCRVALVTAVDPDFDVLDLGFDAYLTKPISQVYLRETVDRLVRLSTYDAEIQRYFALVTKRATLQTQKSDAELETSAQYQALVSEIATLEDELEDIIDDLSVTDYQTAFRQLTQGSADS